MADPSEGGTAAARLHGGATPGGGGQAAPVPPYVAGARGASLPYYPAGRLFKLR